MKQTCSKCDSLIEVRETDYTPGERVVLLCPLCRNEVVFDIPVATEPVSAEIKTPEKKEKSTHTNKELEKQKQKTKELQKQLEALEREREKEKEKKLIEAEENKQLIKAAKIIAAIFVVVGGIIGGSIYYNNVYLPNKRDAEAPRYYTFASMVSLRSEPQAEVDYTKIASLPYGTELITYEHGAEWSKVKVNKENSDGKKLEGYISSKYILNKRDFNWLTSIFGDSDSKSVLSETRYRRALLSYFKKQGYVGDMSQQKITESDIPITISDNDHRWQVFCKDRKQKTNNVYFRRLLNSDSKYKDCAVIIQNIMTQERKLLYFYFDDDETPYLLLDQYAPRTGYIKKIELDLYFEPRAIVEYTD